MTFWIGAVSGFFTTAAFVPQFWKTWRSRSADDLSMPMLLTFATGVVGWLTYGIRLRELPIILSNSITLGLTVGLIVMKLKFRRAGSKQP